jgi:hypothetical protein
MSDAFSETTDSAYWKEDGLHKQVCLSSMIRVIAAAIRG